MENPKEKGEKRPVGERLHDFVQEKKTERIFSQVHQIRLNQTSVSHFTE